jgi:hypothetical protein
MTARYTINADGVVPFLDPITFAPTIQHDFIWFDDYELKLAPRPEIKAWLDETFGDTWHWRSERDLVIEFASERDLTVFLLRWT